MGRSYVKVGQFLLLFIFNILVGLDHLINALTFGDGGETISSRLGRRRNEGPIWDFFADTVDFFFFWDKNHTLRSIIAGEGKTDLL